MASGRKRKPVLCLLLLSLDLEDKTSALTSTEKREQTEGLAYGVKKKAVSLYSGFKVINPLCFAILPHTSLNSFKAAKRNNSQ